MKALLSLCITLGIICLLITDSLALEIKKYTAPNGLVVVHVEQHSLPIVMATLLIKASPLNERPDKQGIAHMTAKMLTEGTVNKSASELNEDIEFIGASLETSTGYDYSTLSLSVLKKDADRAFELFSDVVLHPAFRQDELIRQKSLVLGSLMQREEEPSFIANKAFIKEVFGRHAYGRLVEGDAAAIEGLQRDDIVNFYLSHYVPENAILSVVGDLTSAELDALIKKYLSAWHASSAGRSTDIHYNTSSSQNTGVKHFSIDKAISQANIIIGLKGIARDDPDYYAAGVMNYILGGGVFASRLMRVIRDEMGLAYDIRSYFAANKEPGQFAVSVQTKNESAGTVIEETLRQIRKIQSGPVSDLELSDAKAYLTGSFPRKFETSRQVADLAGAIQFYNLGDDYVSNYPDYINKVTKEDVLRVARKYLNAENFVIVVVGDRKKLLIPDF